jgi:hypothetical protein
VTGAFVDAAFVRLLDDGRPLQNGSCAAELRGWCFRYLDERVGEVEWGLRRTLEKECAGMEKKIGGM